MVAVSEAIDPRVTIHTADVSFTIRMSSDIERYRIETFETKEPETLRWLSETVVDADVVFDVGANIGLYTIYALLFGGPSVRAVSFEPSALNFSRLCLNLADNALSRRATALAVGLGDAEGVVDFELSDLEPGSALHHFDGDDAGGFHQGCPVWTLDGAIFGAPHLPMPTHLKIDVDGPELAVLRGARRTLAEPGLRHVLVEVSTDTEAEALGLLRAAGFVVSSEGLAAGGMRNVILCRPK